MRTTKSILVIAGLLSSMSLFAQDPEDTIRVLNLEKMIVPRALEVVVIRMVPLSLRESDIELLNPDDAGELISKLPGTTVKSYGGLGGLKSVSVRGLGGEHTAVVVDGFRMVNTQTGQMNLGQIQADGVKSAEVANNVPSESLLPVSSVFSGNVINLSTFLGGYNWKKNLTAIARYGSFGRKEAYIRGHRQKDKTTFSAFAKYRDAVGNYPFEYLNGTTVIEGIRTNNDYADLNFGASARLNLKESNRLRFIYRGSMINQGLPGAVVFYNETADERMKTADHRLMMEYYFGSQKGNGRIYANGGVNQLDYSDPTYLNASGSLQERYLNTNITAGYLETYGTSKIKLKWGVEQAVDVLTGNRENLGQPVRSSTYLLGTVEKELYRYNFAADLGGQAFYDENKGVASTNFQFTPVARMKINWTNRLRFNAWYKRTFRMPTFNELYFGSIGNEGLLPERAHQADIGMNWLVKTSYNSRFSWQIDADAFYNAVQDKIVAIPAKNLFVWTIQNVGKAEIYGGTVGTRISMVRERWKLLLTGNYTWQRVLDVTPGSITFGDRIAYTPEHVGNLGGSIELKGFTFGVSNNAVSGRYALNENIPANYLPGFWTTDLTAGYKYTFQNGHKLSVQLNAKNIANTQYAFIRSYAMPGRHYLIALKYEIF